VSAPGSTPIILLLHDGELADIRAILDDAGAVYLEWIGTATRSYEFSPWDLVVCTGSQLGNLDAGSIEQKPIRIAILDKETQAHDFGSDDADYIVRRPVHPTALRLLIQHVLYRGPERRGMRRVALGVPVEFQAGLRRRPATLIDLSTAGCRLLTGHSTPFGARATVYFPPQLGDGRPFSASGQIVRVGPGEGDEVGIEAVSIRFDASCSDQLHNVVELHVQGPATHGPAPSIDADALAPGEAHRDLPPSEQGAFAEQIGRDRRLDIRVAYPRRVVSLGENAAHVLIGRDLSMGGMWVEPNPWLVLGDELRVAIHARPGQDPLVVDARVDRGDQTAGFALLFRNLSDQTLGYLTAMLDALPDIDTCAGSGSRIVVSSIVEDDDG